MQEQPNHAIKIVLDFMPKSQIAVIASNMRGNEKQFFFDNVVHLAQIIAPMPKTYESAVK